MISLFLDTSSSRLIIGLYKDKKEILLENIPSNNDLSRKVLDHIKKNLDNVNIPISKIDEIYVVTGPGSFTGIRVGVTIAKTLAYTLNKTIYEVSELKVMASTKTDKKIIVPYIDARRGYVYAGIYNNNLKVFMKDQYILKEELINILKNKYRSENIELVSYDFEEAKIPKLNIEKLLNLVNFKAITPHNVVPNYLKKTEAEEKLNDKNN